MKSFKKNQVALLCSSVAMGGAGFNADAFLSMVTEAKMQDSVIPHPAGEFEGAIDSVKLKNGTSKTDGALWVKVTAKIRCTDANAVADSGLEELFVYDDFFLDLTDDNGLDNGANRNVALGKYRSAIGKNEDGEEFSISMLKDSAIAYTVKHRMNESGEPSAYVSAVYAVEGDEEA